MVNTNWGSPTRLGVAIVGLFLTFSALAQDNVQARFDEAMSDIEQEKYRTAQASLSAILSEFPNMQRVRLELARVQYLTYDYDEAERLAQQVLDDPNTPASVQTTVLAFLAQIREDQRRLGERHLWGPSIYFGTMYDSNVNFGPSRDIIDIGGVPFIVLPGSQETSDWAAVINPAITHTFNPGKRFRAGEGTGLFAWQGLASLYYRAYFEEDDFNFGVLTLRTGPTWLVPQHWRASLHLQADQIWLGGSDLALFLSLNPNFTWYVGKDTELIFDSFLTNRDYSNSFDRDRDGDFISGIVSVNHYLRNAAITLQGGLGYRDFDAKGDRFTYDGPELFAGLTWNAWDGGSLFGRVGYRAFDFSGFETAFGVQRDDDEYRYSAGAQHQFGRGFMRDWVLVGSWTYTDNQSKKTPIFDFDRHEFNIGLSRFF
ncbi:MAG: tetratricopeptide repeat protein [Gammaproteobacteria bacterium]|nr:tetratricopeptide repeat protein [Gammaproteobacteria bacterium]